MYLIYFEDYEQAIEAFRNQVTAYPDHVEAWQALGTVEAALGNIAAAKTAFARVLATLSRKHPDEKVQNLRADAEVWLVRLADAREGEPLLQAKGASP